MGLLYAYDDLVKNKEIFTGGCCLTGDTAYMNENDFVCFIARPLSSFSL